LCANRQVTHEEATAKSSELGIMFMETSAKAGHNVKSLFKKIAMTLPGMDKESQATEPTNTSAFLPGPRTPMLMCKLATEIDVSTTPANDVPEASQCNC
jgi:Ras-related protein Rab-6A